MGELTGEGREGEGEGERWARLGGRQGSCRRGWGELQEGGSVLFSVLLAVCTCCTLEESRRKEKRREEKRREEREMIYA
jgi:hypothetical protein